MTRSLALLFLGASLSLLVGCGPQWTRFEFQNRTNDERVWVHDLQPLENAPLCGNLGPGGEMTGHMSRQEIPEKLTIFWRPVAEGERLGDMFRETEWTRPRSSSATTTRPSLATGCFSSTAATASGTRPLPR